MRDHIFSCMNTLRSELVSISDTSALGTLLYVETSFTPLYVEKNLTHTGRTGGDQGISLFHSSETCFYVINAYQYE